MRTIVPLAAFLLIAAVAALPGQALSFPNPLPPGASVTVQILNTTGTSYSVAVTNTLVAMLQPTGDKIVPDATAESDALQIVPPGGSVVTGLQVPASGAGSQGSFVLYTHVGAGAVARADVGAPTPGFPVIHTFPAGIVQGLRAFVGTGVGPFPWAFGNVSNVPFTFGSNDVLQVMLSGTATAVASLQLNGILIPPGSVVYPPLPTAGLTPGPYTVQIDWIDPVAGPQVRRFGIRGESSVDLHAKSGPIVPLGGSAEFTLYFDGVAVGIPTSPQYALMIGFQPGSTPLPGGAVLPLIADPLALASLSSNLFGLLGNNLGTAQPYIYCNCPPNSGTFYAPGITLQHPNAPGVTGVALRAAALLLEPITGQIGASQPLEFSLQ